MCTRIPALKNQHSAGQVENAEMRKLKYRTEVWKREEKAPKSQTRNYALYRRKYFCTHFYTMHSALKWREMYQLSLWRMSNLFQGTP